MSLHSDPSRSNRTTDPSGISYRTYSLLQHLQCWHFSNPINVSHLIGWLCRSSFLLAKPHHSRQNSAELPKFVCKLDRLLVNQNCKLNSSYKLRPNNKVSFVAVPNKTTLCRTQITYLGIIFDKQLHWKTQVHHAKSLCHSSSPIFRAVHWVRTIWRNPTRSNIKFTEVKKKFQMQFELHIRAYSKGLLRERTIN